MRQCVSSGHMFHFHPKQLIAASLSQTCHGQKLRANVAIMAGGQVLWLSPHQTARFPRQAALNAQAATLIRNHQITMQPTTQPSPHRHHHRTSICQPHQVSAPFLFLPVSAPPVSFRHLHAGPQHRLWLRRRLLLRRIQKEPHLAESRRAVFSSCCLDFFWVDLFWPKI